MIINMNLGKMF